MENKLNVAEKSMQENYLKLKDSHNQLESK